MKRRFVLAAVVAGVCIPAMTLVSFELNAPTTGPAIPLSRSVIGASYLVTGLIAWYARPANRIGHLMLAAGFVWELTDFNLFYGGDPTGGFLFTLVILAGPLFVALLAVILLTFPSGRAESPLERWLVLTLPSVLVTLQVAVVLVGGPGQVDCRTCPPDLLAVLSDRRLALVGTRAVEVVTVLGAVAVVGVVGRRWFLSSAVGRRSLDPVVWSIGPIFVVGVAIRAAELLLPYPHNQLFFAVSPLVFVALPVGLLFGLLRTRLDRTGVGRLVVKMGARGGPGELRDTLARVLHDPSVELLDWSQAAGGYVTSTGEVVPLPTGEGDRAVTLLERDGQPIGAITHDPLVSEDPQLVRAVASAAQLAVENEHLATELKAQLMEVEASRARIVTATDEERRRLEQDLHDGAQQRLLAVAFALKAAQRAEPDSSSSRERLDEAAEQLALAIGELRQLAHGIRPAILSEGGLAPALQSLAEHAPVKVRVRCEPEGRFAQPIEAAAYFVVSEALANVAKHAGASSATVGVWRQNGYLKVEIHDDGAGGADIERGSGLRGLADRVAALGGQLHVDSPRGAGTLVAAEMPCA